MGLKERRRLQLRLEGGQESLLGGGELSHKGEGDLAGGSYPLEGALCGNHFPGGLHGPGPRQPSTGIPPSSCNCGSPFLLAPHSLPHLIFNSSVKLRF